MRVHGTKSTLVFLPADGEASCLLAGGTVQPENTYSGIKETVQINVKHLPH